MHAPKCLYIYAYYALHKCRPTCVCTCHCTIFIIDENRHASSTVNYVMLLIEY